MSSKTDRSQLELVLSGSVKRGRLPSLRPQRHLCAVCGEELSPPYWRVDGARLAHERCMSWCGRPFPYAALMGQLRHLEHLSRGSEKERLVRAYVRAIAAAQRAWRGHPQPGHLLPGVRFAISQLKGLGAQLGLAEAVWLPPSALPDAA